MGVWTLNFYDDIHLLLYTLFLDTVVSISEGTVLCLYYWNTNFEIRQQWHQTLNNKHM